MSVPAPINRFEFVVVASLRAAQLVRGCTPRVPARSRCTTTACREVQAGKCVAAPRVPRDVPPGGAV